jgi:hypothetical protein
MNHLEDGSLVPKRLGQYDFLQYNLNKRLSSVSAFCWNYMTITLVHVRRLMLTQDNLIV